MKGILIQVHTMLIWLITLLSWNIRSSECLECAKCTNVQNISSCHTSTQCSQDENCFTTVTGQGAATRFTFGCKAINQCRQEASVTTSALGPSFVGRQLKAANSIGCNQCCAADYCNRRVCSNAEIIPNTNGTCEDNSDYNCKLVSGVFNICNDLVHAKTYCRRWCGLCDFVDGGWTEWSTWSQCDVTCATGKRTRSRTCTNPKPSVGGLDCVGNNSEMSVCTIEKCPTHGNWTTWSQWDGCAVSCGVGLEHRDRSCTQPTPGPHGHPCDGDAHDYKVCMVNACADGQWATWSTWGACTATCYGGLRVQTRTCNNPSPFLLGKACPGSSEKYETCNNNACSNPMVYFTVNSPNGTLVSGGRPIFTHADSNIGGGYYMATAIFTCPVAGLYHFSLSFTVHLLQTDVRCYLYHHSNSIVAAAISSANNGQYQSASAAVYVYLKIGDTFDIRNCNEWNYVNGGAFTMFTGALITPS